MAINAPIIRPDPTGEYQRAFQTADTSARAYAALALERQKMEADAIQRARENKANDFKMMMMALERPDKLKQEEIANKQKQQQLDIEADRNRAYQQAQQFSNETARINAQARLAEPSGRSVKTTYSVASFTGEGGTDSTNKTDATDSSTTNTGAGVTRQDDNTVNDLSDGQGPNDYSLLTPPTSPAASPAVSPTASPTSTSAGVPYDAFSDRFNGESFIPLSLPSANGEVIPVAPMATPGVVPATAPYDAFSSRPLDQFTGGSSVPLSVPPNLPAPSTQSGTPASEIPANPQDYADTLIRSPDTSTRMYPPGDNGVVRLPTGETVGPDPTLFSGLRTPQAYRVPEAADGAPGGVGPQGVSAAPAMPPTLAPSVPPSIKAVIGDELNSRTKRIQDLSKESQKYMAEANKANSLASNLTYAQRHGLLSDPENAQPAINSAIERQNDRMAAATNAAADAKKAEDEQKVITTRFNALSELEGIESVLPENDYTKLVDTLKNPQSGKPADETLLKLVKYKQVRDNKGLTHQSNGLRTASRVAEIAAQMDSPEGVKLEQAAIASAGIDKKLALEEAKPLAERNLKRIEALDKEQIKYSVQSDQWVNLNGMYEAAIEADKRVEAPVKTTSMGENKAFWSATEPMQRRSEPAPALPPEAPITNAPWSSLVTPTTGASRGIDQAQANAFWDEGKRNAAEAAKLSQAPDDVLKGIVEKRRPSSEVGFDVVGAVAVPTYAETIASNIKGAFKMPEGANNKRITGRMTSAAPTVEEFLIEAAKAELAKRGVKTTGGGTQTAPPSPKFSSLLEKSGMGT